MTLDPDEAQRRLRILAATPEWRARALRAERALAIERALVRTMNTPPGGHKARRVRRKKT